MTSSIMAGVSSIALSSPSLLVSPSSSLLRQSITSVPRLSMSIREGTFSCGVLSNQAFLFNTQRSNEIATHAVAEDVTAESSAETAETAETSEVSKLKLESDILKKKAKRAELRRKRLVRKRHLRKKGRWPPSKMAKLKNV